jgi:hypothetical protein
MSALKNITIGISILILLLAIPFLFMWNDHTSKIQIWVAEDFEMYQEPNWDGMDIQSWTKAAFDTSKVLGGQWDIQERYDYSQSITDVIRTLVNSPEDVDVKMEAANLAYDEWKDAVEYFTNNRLYAMYYTF